jgi:hypothetical protein
MICSVRPVRRTESIKEPRPHRALAANALHVFHSHNHALDRNMNMFRNWVNQYKICARARLIANFNNPGSNISVANLDTILSAQAPRILQFAMKYAF